MKPKRLSQREMEGERSLEMQKASVQLELAQAMEDHDVDTIRRVLPRATNLGVDPQELAVAKRIMSFEVQQSVLEEVEGVRGTVRQLAESVAKVQAAALSRAKSPALALPSVGSVERQVWSKLEPKIERILQGAVTKASRQLQMASEAALKALEACTFEHFDTNGDGVITREEFEEGRKRILGAKDQKEPIASVQASKATKAKPMAPEASKPTKEAKTMAPEVVQVAKIEAKPKAKADGPSEDDKALSGKVRRMVYATAARRQKALDMGPDHYSIARCVVKHLIQKGSQMALTVSRSDDAHATACAEIAAIRASKQRIEEAEKRAEHKLHTASSKVQAHARGKQVRQQKAKLEKGAVVLQRGLRRLRQRWQQGKTLDFAAAVRAVSGRRKDWALEFQACAGPKGLDASGFAKALGKVYNQLSRLQVGKLWKGFIEQSENCNGIMHLPTFWAICEAVAQGDAAAAEFADMSIEEYLEGQTSGEHYTEEEVHAAQRIQAAQKGRQVRDQASQQAAEEEAARRIQAAHQGRMVREAKAAPNSCDAEQEAAVRIQAAHRGRQVRQSLAKPMPAQADAEVKSPNTKQKAAASLLKAAKDGSLAKSLDTFEDAQAGGKADAKPAQEKAATKIQAVQRGKVARAACAAEERARDQAVRKLQKGMRNWQARRRTDTRDWLGLAHIMRSKHAAFATIFEEAMKTQTNGPELLHPAFVNAIMQVSPAVSGKQAEALFEAVCEGTGQPGVGFRIFCNMSQAVLEGDAAASAFADMHVQDYSRLRD
ncbi:unnamed protein product [Effrenium voratum]|uniref:EF-hand domain-containing protein n=1 Tax=Effrenium voratum TaxID=2562239 RepID=A0AA36NIB5_9DINO|nr:unnamed protein product [Effrenium voratum]